MCLKGVQPAPVMCQYFTINIPPARLILLSYTAGAERRIIEKNSASSRYCGKGRFFSKTVQKQLVGNKISRWFIPCKGGKNVLYLLYSKRPYTYSFLAAYFKREKPLIGKSNRNTNLQRAGGAESPAEHGPANGPWRAR